MNFKNVRMEGKSLLLGCWRQALEIADVVMPWLLLTPTATKELKNTRQRDS